MVLRARRERVVGIESWDLGSSNMHDDGNENVIKKRLVRVTITVHVRYLTIRLRARVFYEQIVNEAQPS